MTSADILLLKDGRLSINDGIERLTIPVRFTDIEDNHLTAFPAIFPGEESNIYTFLFYSTTDYEGTTYATISTVVCVPKDHLDPFTWIPVKFTDRTPSGIGDVNEDPRYHLYNLMTTNETGESVRMLPKHINSDNDKPWEDYKLWIYKDFSKAYPLTQLRRIFEAHHSGQAVAFSLTASLSQIRPENYTCPTSIDSNSLSVTVEDSMDIVVNFTDRFTQTSTTSVSYDYTIEQLKMNLYWDEVASGSVKGAKGTDIQSLRISKNLDQDKKHRIRIQSRWSQFPRDRDVAEVVHGFATIAGTVTGRDEDDDSDPHNFDDIIFQGSN